LPSAEARPIKVALLENQTSQAAINHQKGFIMGDKSPKSVNKKASQKQAKANDASKKKQAVVSAQQATKAKAAAAKKK
jgi:hypothetical protein